jgi:hypothetical protein
MQFVGSCNLLANRQGSGPIETWGAGGRADGDVEIKAAIELRASEARLANALHGGGGNSADTTPHG